MRYLILVLIIPLLYSQSIVSTREYKIDILPRTESINIMELISKDSGIFSVELKYVNDIDFKSKKRTECELNFEIISKLSGTIDVLVCEDVQHISGKALVDYEKPFLEIRSKRSVNLSGELVLWVSGKFIDIFQELVENNISTNETENGILREWYDNGKLFTEYSYKNERRHGIQKKWYKNGQLMQLYNYTNGKLHGLQQKWYKDGVLKAEWSYSNDQLHGYSKEWFPNSQQKYVKKYDYGLLIETIELYDKDGIPID